MGCERVEVLMSTVGKPSPEALSSEISLKGVYVAVDCLKELSVRGRIYQAMRWYPCRRVIETYFRRSRRSLMVG